MRGGDASGHEDALLSSMYQQIAEVREPQFAARYDLEAGLDRYRAWLGEHAVVATSGTPAAEGGQTNTADVTMPLRAVGTEPVSVERGPRGHELYSGTTSRWSGWPPCWSGTRSTAEEVVQDAFVAMHDGWHRLKDTEKALAYLRQAVVNRSRSVLRHRVVVEKNPQKRAAGHAERRTRGLRPARACAVINALRDLPERQREAIVLRYYADLSEADIAATMRISRGAVKSHTARGMAALRGALEQDDKDGRPEAYRRAGRFAELDRYACRPPRTSWSASHAVTRGALTGGSTDRSFGIT